MKPTWWSAPSWLFSSVGRALHWYRRGHGFKSHAGLNFFQALLSLVFITAKITFIFTSLSVYSSNIWLSYKRREYIWLSYIPSHFFATSHVYLEPTCWPAPSWLVSSIGGTLHRYPRDHGFKSYSGLNFFSGLIFRTAPVVFITAKIPFIFTFKQIAYLKDHSDCFWDPSDLSTCWLSWHSPET